ncbi:MAG: hypothetical protein GC159_06760 [Phycisphaera sp.]|nr:hypothetical protein [Phycisphaera sp.]
MCDARSLRRGGCVVVVCAVALAMIGCGGDAVEPPKTKTADLSGQQISDAQIDAIAADEWNAYVILKGSTVTDDQLAKLAGMKRLTSLDLSDTSITDAGLSQLTGLGTLSLLNVSGTQVTDAGLAHLQGMTGLTMLEARGTRVTSKAADALAAARPGLLYDLGG